MSISVRNLLREGTNEHHKKIEGHFNQLISRIDRSSYIWILEKHFSFYSALERKIDSVSDLLPSLI